MGTDVNKMTVKELKVLLEEKGIEIPDSAKKAELVALLLPDALGPVTDEEPGSKAVVESGLRCPVCGSNRIRVGSVTAQCEICYGVFRK